MLVTAVGPIMYGIIFFISTRLLSSVLSVGNNNYYYSMSSVNMTGIAIAFIAWNTYLKKDLKQVG